MCDGKYNTNQKPITNIDFERMMAQFDGAFVRTTKRSRGYS